MINSTGLTDLAGVKQSQSSRDSGWLDGCSNSRLPDYGQREAQQTQSLAARASIPEDSARRLFDTLYDALVFASSEDRRKAVLMLVAAYDLLV